MNAPLSWLSILSGAVCLIVAVPAALIGVIAYSVDWSAQGAPDPQSAAMILPWVLRYLTPPLIAALGLGAVAAAVMSSVASSVLASSSMAAWNIYPPAAPTRCENRPNCKGSFAS